MRLDLLNGVVELSQGGGARASHHLVEDLIFSKLGAALERCGEDAALLQTCAGQTLAMASDSHVISPVFFPGGDIGSLSVHGTVNDLSVAGARPSYLSLALIIEEGFKLSELSSILESVQQAALTAGVRVVTGDTKVVPKGAADGIFINTTGVGFIPEGVELSLSKIRPGDQILVNGTLGDHGASIMAAREQLSTEKPIRSDSQPLNELCDLISKNSGTRYMRDPTRGGLSSALNEIAHACGLDMNLSEDAIPVRKEIGALCELLGLDPLNLANEGKVLVFCAPQTAKELLSDIRQHPQGQNAQIIGEVTQKVNPIKLGRTSHADSQACVEITNAFGGKRILDWKYSDPLPRIC